MTKPLTANQKSATRLMILALSLFANPALVMLLLGAAHSHDARVPAPGYAAVFFTMFALRWFVAAMPLRRVRFPDGTE